MATPIPLNQCTFSAEEVIRATGALLSGDHDLHVTSVSIDTRNLRPGALFVALRGVRDGHEFVDAAATNHAAAALVERGRRHPTLPCFEVDDSLTALGALARHHLERSRAARSLRVVAIGGAAGKTTTKELTSALMRSLFGEVLASPGNLNNLIGVPMTLLTLTNRHRAAVIECGTNQQGEIARLGQIVRPDVALVLNADVEHTEGLGSLEGVADEEAALFSSAHTAVANAGEEMLAARIPPAMRTVWFGADQAADVRLIERNVIATGRQQIKLGLAHWMVERDVPQWLEAELTMLGAAIAENAAAAVAAAAAAWLRPFEHQQITDLGRALTMVRAVPGRLSAHELGGIVVIDDSYNANPRSVRAALAAALETANALRTRLVVALGDMLELGELSPAMHAAVARDVLTARPAQIILVGREFASAIKTLPLHEGQEPGISCAEDSAEAAGIVRRIIRPGDVLLVKGSRAIRMERVISNLPAA
jgi:UDP-N-acetylmuramoyl-tripeptide--D-alanyl-D-alanine ligase